MGKKVMTEVEKSIHEESEKISEARKAIKARKQIIDNSDIIPEELASDDWKAKEFSFPGNTVRIGTIFSGIRAHGNTCVYHRVIRCARAFSFVAFFICKRVAC